MSHLQPFENRKSSHGKAAYRTPTLKVYGDIRDVTLGGTPGSGESGMAMGVKKPSVKI